MPNIDGYVIVTAEGKLKTRGGRTSVASVYPSLSLAQSWARRDGDSVMRVTVDMEREPVFIRHKKL